MPVLWAQDALTGRPGLRQLYTWVKVGMPNTALFYSTMCLPHSSTFLPSTVPLPLWLSLHFPVQRVEGREVEASRQTEMRTIPIHLLPEATASIGLRERPTLPASLKTRCNAEEVNIFFSLNQPQCNFLENHFVDQLSAIVQDAIFCAVFKIGSLLKLRSI